MNNVSSINAYNGWLDNSASNVANATKAGEKSLQSTITSSQNGSPQLSTTMENRASDLQKEMTDQIVIKHSTEADAAAIRTENEMNGSQTSRFHA